MRALRLLFSFLQKLLVRFRGAIVERTGPDVTGNFEAAVVAFEKSMMHLVMKGPQRQA